MKVQDIEEDKPKKKVVIEDNLWKTTDIKEEEVEIIFSLSTVAR